MDLLGLSRISFKHLTVLHVMLTSHSVTKTAESLCVTPSSVSKTLNQLRIILGDELFFRDGTKLVPTPYALTIAPTLHSMLASMNSVMHQASFDPLEYQGSFSLSMRESTFEIFAKPIAALISDLAPHATLTVHSKDQHGFDSLLGGSIDFILLPHDASQPPTNSKGLVWESLYHDEMVCLMSAHHPLIDNELTIENYLSYRHVGIADTELNQPYFEQNLTQNHSARDVAMSVADFGSAALMCQQTNLLFTCSKRWADVAIQAKSLVSKPLPFDYGHVAYSLVWNKPSMNDHSIAWLCDYLKGFS
jgi:DNA-binding transcriptional LysR family regulator